MVSGRSLTFPCPTLTSAGSIEYKGTHLSDVAEAMKKVTMCNGKEGANPAPLSQTEDIQPVPLQYGHVLYSVSSRRVALLYIFASFISHSVFHTYCMHTETPRPQKGHILPSSSNF